MTSHTVPDTPRGQSPLPVAFDPEVYRSKNNDLQGRSEEQLMEHYQAFGRDEGRGCSVIDSRTTFLQLFEGVENKLEIGPFDTPVFTDAYTDYADVLDSDGLRERAIELGRNPEGVPEIRWVLPDGDHSQISGRYDLVVTSHAIEHTPDLVRHLQDVGRLLRPGGRYALIVPDRRYCFDHFLPATTVAQVLAAWNEHRRRHTLESLIEHRAMTTHNDPVRHWAGDHGAPSVTVDAVRELVRKYNDTTGYIDVHAWKFDPEGFLRVLESLGDLGLIPFEIERIHPTIRNTFEFFAVIRLT